MTQTKNKLLQMIKTTVRASTAIDEALAFVEASNKRIAAMERDGAGLTHLVAMCDLKARLPEDMKLWISMSDVGKEIVDP